LTVIIENLDAVHMKLRSEWVYRVLVLYDTWRLRNARVLGYRGFHMYILPRILALSEPFKLFSPRIIGEWNPLRGSQEN
jgi:hypothetical protein